MYLAPDADLDDGLLDVVLIDAMCKARFLRRPAAACSRASTSSAPRSTSCAAREVRISADRPFTVYADGDPIGELPVTVRAIPPR